MTALSKEHEKALQEDSAVSPDVVAARGYRTVTDKGDLEDRGFKEYQRRVPGLLVPMYDPTGAVSGHQFKPDKPRSRDGRTVKYESLSGRRPVVDCPPTLGARLADAAEPLWVTEGSKKADSAVSHGLCCVALAGVDGWKAKDKDSPGRSVPLPEWDALALAGREVYIAYDSDAVTKDDVLRALKDLSSFLLGRGAVVSVVTLPSREDLLTGGTRKQGLDDWFATGGTVEGLLALATRPRVAVRLGANRADADVLRDALGALAATNSPPRLFQRDDELFELRPGVGVKKVSAARLTYLMTESADWYAVGNEDTGPRPKSVPTAIRDLVMNAYELWTFPVLERIVTAPVFSASGHLRTRPGYNAASRTLYTPPPDLVVPDVPDAPTAGDIAKAKALIDELFVDFPLVGASSRAHVWALLLEPFARSMIYGSTPMYVVNAPKQGTGKTLLVRSALIPAMGDPFTMSMPKGDEEMEKRLTSKLIEAAPVIFFDNVTTTVHHASLAAALTSRQWTGRVLGQSATVGLPVNCVFVLAGNNPNLAADFPRRTMPILLDALVEDPSQRAQHQHSLPRWALDNRGALIWAACTLLRAWVVAERPGPPDDAAVPRLGGYGAWRRVLGGVLHLAGVPGLLAHRADPSAIDQSDDQIVFEALCAFMADRYSSKPVSANEVAQDLVTADLAEMDFGQRNNHPEERGKALGYFLRGRKGQRVGNYVLNNKKSGVIKWFFEEVGAP